MKHFIYILLAAIMLASCEEKIYTENTLYEVMGKQALSPEGMIGTVWVSDKGTGAEIDGPYSYDGGQVYNAIIFTTKDSCYACGIAQNPNNGEYYRITQQNPGQYCYQHLFGRVSVEVVKYTDLGAPDLKATRSGYKRNSKIEYSFTEGTRITTKDGDYELLGVPLENIHNDKVYICFSGAVVRPWVLEEDEEEWI